MAVELVIKIPDSLYKKIEDLSFDELDTTDAVMLIRNGTVIPESHGDLIDRDELLKYKYRDTDVFYVQYSEAVNVYNVNRMKPVIKARKE